MPPDSSPATAPPDPAPGHPHSGPPPDAPRPVLRWIGTGARGAAYLTATLGSAMAALLIPPLLAVAVLTLAVGGLGLVLLPAATDALRSWADLHRRGAAAYLGTGIPRPPGRPRPDGVLARFPAALTAPRTRRDAAWALLQIGLGLPLGLLGLLALLGPPATAASMLLWPLAPHGAPLDLAGVPVTDWPTALTAGTGQLALTAAAFAASPPLARLHARATAAVLAPSQAERLTGRVDDLARTRAGAVHSHAAELRRIERDLHDGTQARLVALALRLGLAQRTLGDDPAAAARLLEQAQNGAEEAMAELRAVVRSIYPPVLADRGLEGALAALAADCALPVQMDCRGLGGLSPAVESTAYFIAAESLTNAAKHAEASQVEVSLSRADGEPGLLRIRIRDDGRGGAAPDGAPAADGARGTGIPGMRRRAEALDGTLAVTSPAGGPTAVEAVLPCAS